MHYAWDCEARTAPTKSDEAVDGDVSTYERLTPMALTTTPLIKSVRAANLENLIN